MKFRFFVVALILFISTLTTAEDGLYLHSNWGYNYAFDSVLSIHSSDGDIVHKASWDGKSFTDSPYYTIRLDQWQNETSVGLEWVHYKMYLDNPPAGIDKLSISDGYNILFLNYGKKLRDNVVSKVGAGIIVAHPDVSLSGRERFWNKGGISGAYFAGFAMQLSIERWLYQTRYHLFTTEAKLSAGYARIPISKNKSEFGDVPHIALHVTLGIGSKPLSKQSKPLDYAYYFLVPTLHHYSIYRFSDVKKVFD